MLATDRYALELVTGPTLEPVTVHDAKKQVEIAPAIEAHDDLLERLIVAARETAEAITNRQLLTATWRLYLDRFPKCGPIRLPKGKLQAVSGIIYLDPAGTSQTLIGSVYKVSTATEPGEISLKYSQNWPFTLAEAQAITITYTCGFGAAAANVPVAIRQAILLMVAEWFEQRSAGEVPRGAMALLEQWRYGDHFTNYAG